MRYFLRAGGTAMVWLKAKVEGDLDLAKVPAKLWDEMNTYGEALFTSRSKNLRLLREEAENLRALDFEVAAQPPATPSTEEDPEEPEE